MQDTHRLISGDVIAVMNLFRRIDKGLKDNYINTKRHIQKTQDKIKNKKNKLRLLRFLDKTIKITLFVRDKNT